MVSNTEEMMLPNGDSVIVGYHSDEELPAIAYNTEDGPGEMSVRTLPGSLVQIGCTCVVPCRYSKCANYELCKSMLSPRPVFLRHGLLGLCISCAVCCDVIDFVPLTLCPLCDSADIAQGMKWPNQEADFVSCIRCYAQYMDGGRVEDSGYTFEMAFDSEFKMNVSLGIYVKRELVRKINSRDVIKALIDCPTVPSVLVDPMGPLLHILEFVADRQDLAWLTKFLHDSTVCRW